MTSGSSSPRPTMPFWWLIVASFLGVGIGVILRHGWPPGRESLEDWLAYSVASCLGACGMEAIRRWRTRRGAA